MAIHIIMIIRYFYGIANIFLLSGFY